MYNSIHPVEKGKCCVEGCNNTGFTSPSMNDGNFYCSKHLMAALLKKYGFIGGLVLLGLILFMI